MMKREKNKIGFNDLFSEYEARKAQKEKEANAVPSNKISQSKSPVKKQIEEMWSFLKTPLSDLTNKQENKTASLKILSNYSYLFKTFKVFKRDDIQINKETVNKNTIKASSGIIGLSLITSIFISPLLCFTSAAAFIAGMYYFYLTNNDLNGIQEEILYRKYKAFLSLMIAIRTKINSRDDLEKFLTIMGNNTDIEINKDLINAYTNMLWEHVQKIDSNIDVSSLSQDELIEKITFYFKDLLEIRNKYPENHKIWDGLIELLTHDGIKEDLKTFENMNMLKDN